jgi:L-fucose isomerase-like protein
LTLSIIPFFSPLASEELRSRLTKRLSEAGADICSPDQPYLESKRIYLLVGTGGTENQIIEFIERSKLGSPLILLTYPLNNSLPAALEVRTYLQDEEKQVKIVHGSLETLVHKIKQWLKFEGIKNQLQSSVLGIIGKPSPWLVASHVDYQAVKQQWGLIIKDYPLSKIMENNEADRTSLFLKSAQSFVNHAKNCEVSIDDIQQAEIIGKRILTFLEQEQLNAVTLECFDLVNQTNITGCYALSQLNELENIVAACEGDIPAAFTLLVAKLLTNQPGFMANIVDIDEKTNTLILAHCTVPITLLEKYDITTHFETGKSVAVRGKFAQQPITLVKIGGKDLSKFWVSAGRILENIDSQFGCRTQIRVALEEPVGNLLMNSLANHHIVVLGNHQSLFRAFFDFTSMGE